MRMEERIRKMLEEAKATLVAGRISMAYIHDIMPSDYFALKPFFNTIEQNPDVIYQEKLDGYNMSFIIQLTKDDNVGANDGDYYSCNSAAGKPSNMVFSASGYGDLEIFKIPHNMMDEVIPTIDVEDFNKFIDKTKLKENEFYRVVIQGESLIGELPNATYYDIKDPNSIVMFGATIEKYTYRTNARGALAFVIIDKIPLNIQEIKSIIFNNKDVIKTSIGSIYAPDYINIDDEVTKINLIKFIVESMDLKNDYFSLTPEDKEKIVKGAEDFTVLNYGKKTITANVFSFLYNGEETDYFDLSPFRGKVTPEYGGNYPDGKTLLAFCNNDMNLVKTCMAWRLFLFLKEIEYGEQKLKDAKSVFSTLVGQIEGQIVKFKTPGGEYNLKVINALYRNRKDYIWGLADVVNKYKRNFSVMQNNPTNTIFTDVVQDRIVEFLAIFNETSMDTKFKEMGIYEDVLSVRKEAINVFGVYDAKKRIKELVLDKSYNVGLHLEDSRPEVAEALGIEEKKVPLETARQIKKSRLRIANGYITQIVDLINSFSKKDLTESAQPGHNTIGIFAGRFQGGLSLGHSAALDIILEDIDAGIINKALLSPQVSILKAGRSKTHPFSYLSNINMILKQLNCRFELKQWMFSKYKNSEAVNAFLRKYGTSFDELDNKPFLCLKGKVVVKYIPNAIFREEYMEEIISKYKPVLKEAFPGFDKFIFYFGDEEYAKLTSGKQSTVEKMFNIPGDNRVCYDVDKDISVIFNNREDVDKQISSKYWSAPEGQSFTGTSVRSAIERGDYDIYNKLVKSPLTKKEFEKIKKTMGFRKAAMELAGARPTAQNLTVKMAKKVLATVEKFDDKEFEDYVVQMTLEVKEHGAK